MTHPAAPLTVGVVGAGQIVVDQHLPTIFSLPELRISFLTDQNDERARTVSRAYRIRAIPMPPSLADLPATDVLLLAIPYGVRGPYYDALAGRATSLFVEKPFARTLDEHHRICASFPRSQISIGFQRRSMGTVRFLRRILRERLFGPLREVKIGHGIRGHVSAGTSYASNLAVAGGGILLDVGIHLIDAALFATDAEGIRIESGRMIRDRGFELHTEARATLRLPEGLEVPAEIVVSGLADTIEGIECVFDRAVVFLGFHARTLSVRARSGGRFGELTDPEGGRMEPFQIAHAHWRGFLDSIAEGRSNWTSASETVLTTRAIEGLFSLGEA